MTIFSLFVGINRYESIYIPQLSGCENDVKHISKVLTTRYAIPEENCLILLNEQATKSNIITGFQQHLAQAGAEDTVVFYFSGHGSQEEIDPRMKCIESDEHNETLVCHDSRASELYDLSSKELRYLIHQISQRGTKVITIMDSCHSGNATRDLDEEAKTGVRQSPGGNSIRPLESYIFFQDALEKGWVKDFTQMPEGEHIAISACRSDQLAKETSIYQTKNGVFTYSFCQALEYMLIPPSYRNLVDAAGQKVKSIARLQNPQLDFVGTLDINETFLGSNIQPIVYQVYFVDGGWLMNAGLPQGINANARLQIKDGDREVLVKVVEALYDKSRLQLETKEQLDTNLRYSAEMLDPAIPKLPIAFTGDPDLVQVLRQTLNQSNDRYYLEESTSPEYRLNTTAQEITLMRAEYSPQTAYIPAPQTGKKRSIPLPLAIAPVVSGTTTVPVQTREQISLQLATHMAKWQRTMSLAYTLGGIPENLIEVVIEQYNPLTQQYEKLPNTDDSFTLQYQQEAGGSLLPPRFKLSLVLNPHISWVEDVHVSLLHIDPVTGSIMLMTSAKGEIFRQQERVVYDGASAVTQHVRTHYQYTKPNGSPDINASIPDNLLAIGINQTADCLKLFISNFELDVSNLQQQSLQRYLQGFYEGMRSFDIEEYKPVYKARTKTIALNIIKPE